MKYTLRDESFVDMNGSFILSKPPATTLITLAVNGNITTASKRYDFWHNVYKMQ